MDGPSDALSRERQSLLHARDRDVRALSPSNRDVPEDEALYSTFSSSQKWAITFLVSFAATFSPLSGFIYYPALTSIAKDLGVTVHMIDLTITSYMIVSAVAPSILGDMADRLGRRPVFLLMLSIYLVANVSLAAQRSFAGLVVLRMLQSAGSSGTISSSYAVIADIASPAERGLYVGIFLCGPNLAPSFGPVIGGLLAATVGWRWIFGLLSILSGICLLAILFVLPETNRLLVGDGSRPARGVNRTLASLLLRRSTDATNERPQDQTPRFVFPNPMKSVRLFFYADTLMALWIHGVFYMTYCCLQASLSSVVIDTYGFSEFEAGLVYVPFGIACLIASYVSGRLMNYDYAMTVHEEASYGMNGAGNGVRNNDLKSFPLEKARFRSIPWLISLSVAFTCAYGWALQARLHVSIPIALQVVIGGAMTIIFNISGTLLVDQHPQRPATAQASNNLMRCTLAAAGLAVVQPLIDAVGVGWCYTGFALVSASSLPVCFLEVAKGAKWRIPRQESEPD